MNKDEMLPQDSASWSSILQLDRHSPVSCSPFQISMPPTGRTSFKIPRFLPHQIFGVFSAAIIAGSVWLVFDKYPVTTKTVAVVPVIQTLASHQPPTMTTWVVPPPPPEPAFAEETQAVAVPVIEAKTKKTLNKANMTAAGPLPTTTGNTNYAGVLDAVSAKINETTPSNTTPSIQVRRVNPKELTHLTVKEEVIHE